MGKLFFEVGQMGRDVSPGQFALDSLNRLPILGNNKIYLSFFLVPKVGQFHVAPLGVLLEVHPLE